MITALIVTGAVIVGVTVGGIWSAYNLFKTLRG